MSPEAPGLDLADAGIYPRWSRVTIRYADEDRMGHVNNSSYSVWFEAARVELIETFLAAAPEWIDTVLARITIEFRQETRFPGEVRVGARLLRAGNRSITTGYAVFRDDRCLATAECVNVYFDKRARRSADPTPEMRALMAAEIARAAEPPPRAC